MRRALKITGILLGVVVLLASSRAEGSRSDRFRDSRASTGVPARGSGNTRGTAPIPLDSTRRGPGSSQAALAARRPAFPTYHAPGGGIYVPPELVTLRLEKSEKKQPGNPPFEPRPLGPSGSGGGSIGSNVRVSDPTGEPARNCNSETSVAAWGNFLVAGWNDGEIYPDSPGASGYGYSTDGGRTWTDGGILPVAAPAVYRGDPVITVDGQGNFFYASLYTPDGVQSNLSVNRGRFVGDSLVWDPPVMPVFSTPGDFLDKEWIAADPRTGYVYLTWTRITLLGGSTIEFSRSLDGGVTWSPRKAITAFTTQGVQGSRIVVGPDQDLFVLYYAYEYSSQRVLMRYRRSRDFGVTWETQQTLPGNWRGVFTPYGSGPPGYNRGRGIGLPSLAVDRSTGPRRGSWYAVWEETVDHLRDPLGRDGVAFEVEPNGGPDTATAIPIGAMVHGTLETHHGQDWYRFQGEAGQTVVLYLTPGDTAAGGGDLQLFCEQGRPGDRVAFSELGLGYSLIVYTLPVTGVYYVAIRVSVYTGTYKLATGWHTPGSNDLARDTRDVIFQSSTDGDRWNPPLRLSVGGANTDDSFPEVAVDSRGRVWVVWYAHRVDACAILTDVHATYSDDGGVTFVPDFKINDGPAVNWNGVATNLAPNMGDYIALLAEDCRVWANFADGRDGTPDSWLALLQDCATPVTIAWRGFASTARGVRVAWQVQDGGALEAVIERRQQAHPWWRIGVARADARGAIAFEDPEARPGERYAYRLVDHAGAALTGESWVDVPAAARLALWVEGAAAGAIPLAFALPRDAPARLEVVDIAGRRVRALDVEVGPGETRRRTLGGFPPGLYWVRLSQGRAAASTRAIVLR